MKYVIPILFLVLISCDSNQHYKELTRKFPEMEFQDTKPKYCDEKTEIKSGDSIILYGGKRNFLKTHFGCDTCSAKVASIFFSKPTGTEAFLEFKDQKNQSKVFSIGLYYWDSKRGYSVSGLQLWQRKMTNREMKMLQEDFISSVETHYIEDDIYFKLKK